MSWSLTTDPRALLDAAGPMLRADPVANTVLCTVLTSMAADPPAPGDRLFGWWAPSPGAGAGGVFMDNPPYPVYAGALPAAALPGLADLVAARYPGTLRVGLAGADEPGFRAAWQQRGGGPLHRVRHELLYRWAQPTPPVPQPAGSPVRAGAEHVPLLTGWLADFAAFLGEQQPDPAGLVAARVARGELWLWCDAGTPVAFAGVHPAVEGVARVGPVYTPPQCRGRGYAGALTTAVGVTARAAGAAEVVLFADAANSTSNGLYRRLGYRQVGERMLLAAG